MTVVSDIVTDDIVTAAPTDTVASLIGALLERKETEAAVLDGERCVGMFSALELVRSRIDIVDVKVRTLTKPVPHLAPEDPLLKAASRMYESGHAALPVGEERYAGAVRFADVIRHLSRMPALDGVRIADVRHPVPLVIGPDDRLGAAIEMMHEHRVDRLPVLEDGEVVGFLAFFDLLRRYYAHHLRTDYGMRPRLETKAFEAERPDILALPVRSFMERGEIRSVTENDSVRAAADLMIDKRVLSVLVVNEAKAPLGILTKKDVLEAVLATQFEPAVNIRYAGLNELPIDAFTRLWLQKISSYHAEKLGYFVADPFDIVVHFKHYEKDGRRHKYSVHARISFPGGTIASQTAHDWDIRRTVHRAFGDLESQLRNRDKFNPKERPSRRTEWRRY